MSDVSVAMSAILDELHSTQIKVELLVEALEHARHKMWEYGFSENDLQPIREALAKAGVK